MVEEEYVMGEATEGEREKKSITIYPRGVLKSQGKEKERKGMAWKGHGQGRFLGCGLK